MNTIKQNAAIIKDFKKSKDNIGMKDQDTDIYERLAYDWHKGLVRHDAWVFAPIIGRDIMVSTTFMPESLKPNILRKVRARAHKLLVSKLASSYCKHPWFGKESA